MQLIRFFLLVYGVFWLVRAILRVLPPKQAPGPRAGSGPSSRASGASSGPASAPGPRSPYDILGVQPGATELEIRRAYQAVVQQYHPDQVAHLGIELKELAETRTKEINGAYAALRQSRRGFSDKSN
jgi:DnaJ like chaperone protein